MQSQLSDSAVSSWLHTAAKSIAEECCWSSFSIKSGLYAVYEQGHELLWSTASVKFPWQPFPPPLATRDGGKSQDSPDVLPAGAIATSLSGGSCVSVDRSCVYQATPTLFINFRPTTLTGGFCTLGIISLWTRLGASIPILLSCTMTKCRSVYQVILLLFQDFLHGVANLLTGHRHFGSAHLLPSAGFYSCTGSLM